MNTAAAKQTIKQCFQTLTDEQLQQYHLNHDYFTGRPLAKPQVPRSYNEAMDASTLKKQRNLNSLNDVLYPTPTLGSALAESFAALKISTKAPETAEAMPLEKPSEDLLNRAKQWFERYLADGLESLLPAQANQLSDANIAVIKRAFSRNTILIQNVCMLSPFWIRSPQEWQAKSGTDLLEHLFVEYEAPAFLKACWSNVADEESVRWLLCYILYAQGGSLKMLASYFGWTSMSNKLWHQLFTSPADAAPLHAVLYAEFKRLGGWDEDFACLMANESYVIDLLDPVSEEGRDFWYDTCRWTISKQFDLDSEAHRKVLWWARHQQTEHARNGESYRLQGRSQNKVMESIAEYEREQFLIQQARARMAERARQVSMARNEENDRLRQQNLEEQAARRAMHNVYYYGDYDEVDATWKSRNWDWTTMSNGKSWRFVELTSSQALRTEGQEMEHCVGSYSMACVDGHAAIFSLRDKDGRRATIEVDPLTKYLIQVQGRQNAEQGKAVQSIVNMWLERVVKG